MTNQTFNLKGGVLAIGSLYWQKNLNPNDTIRIDWRNNRLSQTSEIKVKTPIRYGRLSNDGIYTMTFSNLCRGKNVGTGFVIPFSHNPLKSDSQLLKEAQEISTAEGMKGRFIKSINHQPWCVLGILFNKTKISKGNRNILEIWWQQQVEKDADYLNFQSSNFGHGSEKPCILQNGVLNIPWVIPVNNTDQKELDSYDFVIATATLPTGSKYPSVGKIVSSVKNDSTRKYFLNNSRAGITTFQDKRINKKLP